MSPALMTESASDRPFNRKQAIQARAIQTESEAILSRNSHLLNQPIFCSFHEGTLILQGRVRSYHSKQIAQTIVANVAGVVQVVNQIEVDDSRKSLD